MDTLFFGKRKIPTRPYTFVPQPNWLLHFSFSARQWTTTGNSNLSIYPSSLIAMIREDRKKRTWRIVVDFIEAAVKISIRFGHVFDYDGHYGLWVNCENLFRIFFHEATCKISLYCRLFKLTESDLVYKPVFRFLSLLFVVSGNYAAFHLRLASSNRCQTVVQRGCFNRISSPAILLFFGTQKRRRIQFDSREFAKVAYRYEGLQRQRVG